jgi:hypothetical protein
MDTLTFRKTKLADIDFNNYEMKSYDVGYLYNGERYYVYLCKTDNKVYLIRHLYSSFGSDDILISNEPLSDFSVSRLKPFEPLEDDIDTIKE